MQAVKKGRTERREERKSLVFILTTPSSAGPLPCTIWASALCLNAQRKHRGIISRSTKRGPAPRSLHTSVDLTWQTIHRPRLQLGVLAQPKFPGLRDAQEGWLNSLDSPGSHILPVWTWARSWSTRIWPGRSWLATWTCEASMLNRANPAPGDFPLRPLAISIMQHNPTPMEPPISHMASACHGTSPAP